jgi:hypothetical protein
VPPDRGQLLDGLDAVEPRRQAGAPVDCHHAVRLPPRRSEQAGGGVRRPAPPGRTLAGDRSPARRTHGSPGTRVVAGAASHGDGVRRTAARLVTDDGGDPLVREGPVGAPSAREYAATAGWVPVGPTAASASRTGSPATWLNSTASPAIVTPPVVGRFAMVRSRHAPGTLPVAGVDRDDSRSVAADEQHEALADHAATGSVTVVLPAPAVLPVGQRHGAHRRPDCQPQLVTDRDQGGDLRLEEPRPPSGAASRVEPMFG